MILGRQLDEAPQHRRLVRDGDVRFIRFEYNFQQCNVTIYKKTLAAKGFQVEDQS